MLKIEYTNKFKKDYKRILARHLNESLLDDVLSLLIEEKPLPAKYRDHDLVGEYIGCRECHIQPDWLLIYRKDKELLTLILTRTGSHSDLF